MLAGNVWMGSRAPLAIPLVAAATCNIPAFPLVYIPLALLGFVAEADPAVTIVLSTTCYVASATLVEVDWTQLTALVAVNLCCATALALDLQRSREEEADDAAVVLSELDDFDRRLKDRLNDPSRRQDRG